MLGKLIKHEWNATMKVLLPANAVLILITIIGRIMLGTKLFETDNEVIMVIGTLSLTLYILSLFTVSIACSIYLAVRFYKTVYSDESYLLHTLPVTTHEIICSKTLIGSIWIIITSIFVMGSAAILIFGSIDPADMQSLYREMANGIETYFAGSSFAAIVILMIFMFISSAVYSILWIFLSISLGQMMTKHKVLGSFIAYGALYFLMQIITTISMFAFGIWKKAMDLSSAEAVIDYFNAVFIMSLVITLVFSVASYFVTNYMMKNKLNLD